MYTLTHDVRTVWKELSNMNKHCKKFLKKIKGPSINKVRT